MKGVSIMVLGGITNSPALGGWTLKMRKADRLPQDVASAFYDVFDSKKLGVTYVPAYYLAAQLVNGMNHKLIAERTKLVSKGKQIKDFAVVTLNIPAGSIGGKGATKVSEEDATDFVLRDDIEKGFKKAMSNYVGVEHKPIFEIGEQIVAGVNYHFICESRIVHPDAEPYLTRVVINNFKDTWSIVEIEKLQ